MTGLPEPAVPAVSRHTGARDAGPYKLATISLSSNLTPYTRGESDLELGVAIVRYLFAAPAWCYPHLQAHPENGMAVAIDAEISQDAALQPLSGNSEVFVFQKMAGGSRVSVPGREAVCATDLTRPWPRTPNATRAPARSGATKPATPERLPFPRCYG